MLSRLSITLLPQDEYQWINEDSNIAPGTFKEQGRYPLYHQWRTYNAEAPIIVNTHNTGTGKTIAALLRLLKRAQDRGFDLYSTRDDVLLIAPTNELVQQHVEDARQFCQENGLPYRVVPITKAVLEQFPAFSEANMRPATLLHRILNDGSLADHDLDIPVTIYVTNPDIFYYALYFGYNNNDRASLFLDFFKLFNYVIVDEFHYYNPKQLAAFLFFIMYSIDRGYMASPSKQRQICILTATPRPQVKSYLDQLGVDIDWIEPGEEHIAIEDRPFVQPVRALTPAHVYIYNTEAVQEQENLGGLFSLIKVQRNNIRHLLDTVKEGERMEGAIISSSLGMISNIHQELLRGGTISKDLIGRITGPEDRSGRNQAKDKPLILATPTVDIGYNFGRSYKKQRQTIDFLFFDAFSGDEFIQRLGRAGRILAAVQKDHKSLIYAVVDPASYQLLQPFDGKQLERSQLAKLAEEMAKKHDLYAYVRSGALLEVFRPLYFLGQGMSDQEREGELNAFLQALQTFFALQGEDKKRKPLTYADIARHIRPFEAAQNYYSHLKTVPNEAFEWLPLFLKNDDAVPPQSPQTRNCLELFERRLIDAQSKRIAVWKTYEEAATWIQKDLSTYFREKARFSFRDSFQPPLALLYDPERLHSSKILDTYNALHFLRYYEATFYETKEEWEQQTKQRTDGFDLANVLAFCKLNKLRDIPLRIGLTLDARRHSQDEWEELYAYQVTALYGLKIEMLNDQRGLQSDLRDLFCSRYVPTYPALRNGTTDTELLKLRKRARLYAIPMEVTFRDGTSSTYNVTLGSMAFLVSAEIPRWAVIKDRGKVQREDDAPIIL